MIVALAVAVAVAIWVTGSPDRVATPLRSAVRSGTRSAAGQGKKAALQQWEAGRPEREQRLKDRQAWLTDEERGKARRFVLAPAHKVWRKALGAAATVDRRALPVVGATGAALIAGARSGWRQGRDAHAARRAETGRDRVQDAADLVDDARDSALTRLGRCTWTMPGRTRIGRTCKRRCEEGSGLCPKHRKRYHEAGRPGRKTGQIDEDTEPAGGHDPYGEDSEAEAAPEYLRQTELEHEEAIAAARSGRCCWPVQYGGFDGGRRLCGDRIEDGFIYCRAHLTEVRDWDRGNPGDYTWENQDVDESSHLDPSQDTPERAADQAAIAASYAPHQTTPTGHGQGNTTTKENRMPTGQQQAQLDIPDMDALQRAAKAIAAAGEEMTKLAAHAETSKGLPDALSFEPGRHVVRAILANAEAAPGPRALTAWVETAANLAREIQAQRNRLAPVQEDEVKGHTDQLTPTG